MRMNVPGLDLLRQEAEARMTTIRVWPANEQMRAGMKHPRSRKFGETMLESVAWPLDSFTKRRLREGVVLDHPPAAAEEKKPEEAAPQPAAAPSGAKAAAPKKEEPQRLKGPPHDAGPAGELVKKD